MGRAARINLDLRNTTSAEADLEDVVTLDRKHTRPWLGAAWVRIPRVDRDRVREMVATASVEAKEHFAVWDAQGVGVSMETAAYDIANLAALALAKARSLDPSTPAVMTSASVLLGDWATAISVRQERPGDAVEVRIIGTERYAFDRTREMANQDLAGFVRAWGPQSVVCGDGFVVLVR